MASRYEIWNKEDPIITPIGEVFSASQWIARYPAAGIAGVKVVCAAGEVKGSYFGLLSLMRQSCQEQGADFTECQDDEDVLDVIEAWEDTLRESAGSPTPEERIAAALEYQVLSALPDEEEAE